MQGKIKHVNSEKGYGFIATETGDVFFHVSQVIGPEPQKDDIVTYSIKEGRKGPEACNVSVLHFNQG